MGARPQGGADSRRSAAGPRRCERCHTPVIKQLVGDRAALNVIANADPMPRAEALRLVEPNRLAWCLAVLRGGGVELRWRCPSACGHEAVIEHRCPAGTPLVRRPEGTLW
ncbi:hypothetical protein [Streptomyces sp. AK02-04a]|uniref:hypothetical protein n=1 Tax=Streptomyces sp. AK02-04a TaxID=3028649 RepID=UPI0029A8D50C|nr:hypothetical protein [Streptomyces sp. AK02-04a]MDX3759300.1 hypothetical protein [Streptomyces sp. AK02-04a]